MTTQRCVIDDRIVRNARAMVDAGDVDDHIFADTETTGLRLRVRRRNASWELKCGSRTLCIGRLDRMFAKEARARARIGRDLLAGGVDPNPFFSSRLAGLSETQARLVAHEKHGSLPEPGKESGQVWTLDELMRRYVDEHLAKPRIRKNKSPKPPSEHTVKDAKGIFSKPAFDGLRGKALGELNAELLFEVGDKIGKVSGGRTREKVFVYVRGALSWARRLRVRPAGLAVAWWADMDIEPAPPVRPQNTLFVDDVGRLLAIAELNRTVPGRLNKKQTSDMTLCMLWWLVVTAQRTTASSLVLQQHVVSHRRRGWEGWGIVSYPAENMKSRRFHALPLPPLAMAVVERARAAAQTMKRADSEWLFPSVRTASKTRARCDMGATERAVSQLLRRLRGEDDAGLAVGAPNLLRDLPHFTPHNIRHSFATRLGDSLAAGGSVSAVFDHSVAIPGEKEFQRSSMLDVYDKSHRLPLKAQALSHWCFSVYDRYERALDELMKTHSAFAEAKPWRFTLKEGVLLKPWEQDDDDYSKMK